MKRYLLLALGVFLAMPAAVGAVDAWCYVLLGRAVIASTSIGGLYAKTVQKGLALHI